MSSDIITLKVTERNKLGKGIKELRREGMVPGNMYARGKASVAVSAVFNEITKVYTQAGKHHPVELVVDGKTRLVMFKDVAFDPVKNTLSHVGFHAINRNEKVEAEVPVKIEGEIPAEKLSLLVLQNLDTVEVEALPSNLPDVLYVPGSKLVEDGDKVTVEDIVAPEGVTILTDLTTMVADVQVPRDQIADADAALEEAKDASDVESENGAETPSDSESTEE